MTRVQQEVEPYANQTDTPNQPVSLFTEFEDAVTSDEKKQEAEQQEVKETKHHWTHWSNWTGWSGILGPYIVERAFKTSPKRLKHRHSGAGLLAKTSPGIRPVSTTDPDSTSIRVEEGTSEQKENNDTSTSLDAKIEGLHADDLPPPPMTAFNTNPAL